MQFFINANKISRKSSYKIYFYFPLFNIGEELKIHIIGISC